MHEMALAESVLAIVEQAARAHAAARVRSVRLEIGALSHVAPDALRTCFDVVKQRSIADGASLEISSTPGAAWCMPCGKRVPLAARGDSCPDCGSYQLQVAEGEQMRVRDIEIA